MISTSELVAYISEPFNIRNYDPGICPIRFQYWFTHVCEENECEYLAYLRNTVQWRYNLRSALKSARHPAHAIRIAGKCMQFTWYRWSRVRPLLKDPIALFSAEWLFLRFKTQNVVMIRHPAAFAGSLKERRWTHPFSHFADQPLLMRSHLQPFEKQIRRFVREDKDIIDQAALLWNLIHYMVLKYKKAHPDWIYLRHEDLSRNPVDGFRSLFSRLNLDFSEHTAEEISKHSFGTTTQTTAGLHNLKRDSVANIDTWKTRLSRSEVDRLKSQVHDISKCFYSDDEW